MDHGLIIILQIWTEIVQTLRGVCYNATGWGRDVGPDNQRIEEDMVILFDAI